MSDVPAEMIPPQSVHVGGQQPDTASGEPGTHNETEITIEYMDGGSDTFTATVDVEPNTHGDSVRILNAPTHASVEMLGYAVNIRAEPVADGEYVWGDEYNSPDFAPGTKEVVLSQYVPCPICESDLTDEYQPSEAGPICRLCDYKLNHSEVRE